MTAATSRALAARHALLQAEAIFAPFIAILAVFHIISYDLGIALILLSFAPALFPAVAENFRKKIGWNVHSTLLTTMGEWAILFIFLAMGLMVSVLITAFLSAVWTVLLAQSFMYGGAK